MLGGHVLASSHSFLSRRGRTDAENGVSRWAISQISPRRQPV
ncbi:hypothetical protein ASAP_0009 [Asaia bogorensis]|uniref:Uncharacterized protein n=1 Tax=Asaia bogorensis TaxID=91915 RepID=A0A060QAE2_9PROT|nr:hypothetical protein ASAP_0009 [Asaia bogorensis]